MKVFDDVFNAHPFAMSVFYALTGYGIRAFAGNKKPKFGPNKQLMKAGFTKKKELSEHHVQFMLLGLLGLFVGAYSVQYNKFKKGLEHFKSYHSIFGVITVLIGILNYFFGFLMYFFPKLVTPILRRYKITFAYMWRLHRLTGYIISFLAYISLIFAMNSLWFQNHLRNFSEISLSIAGYAFKGDRVYYAMGITSASLICLGNIVQLLLFQ